MKAIISGSAGIAIVVNEGKLFSIDVRRPDELVPRRPREVAYLFGDTQDQWIVEDVRHDDVKRLLDEAWRGAEALELALIAMDGEKSGATRELAVTELSEALAVKCTARQVEAVLWSRPRPASASIHEAIALCEKVGARAAKTLFEQTEEQQPVIRDVWEAFERMPEGSFGPDAADRARKRAEFVRDGVFRDLVAARATHQSAEATSSLLTRMLGVRDNAGRAEIPANPPGAPKTMTAAENMWTLRRATLAKPPLPVAARREGARA